MFSAMNLILEKNAIFHMENFSQLSSQLYQFINMLILEIQLYYKTILESI